MTPLRTAEFDKGRLWHFRAQPLRAIDGDTCVVLLDTGCYGRYEARVRIASLWAAERNEAGGAEATARLQAALGSGAGAWPLRVISRQRETVVSEVRSFERLVADVYVARDDGALVDIREVVA